MKTLRDFWNEASGIYDFIDKNGVSIDDMDYPLETKILNERLIEGEQYEITLDVEAKVQKNGGNIMLIDKVIEMMLGEDAEMITDFLGYKPDNEVLNNNQLLEEELENVARKMPDDILMKFYERSQDKSKKEAEKNYCLQTIENLLTDMEDCKRKLQYKDKMDSIIEIIDTAITDVEALKVDIE